MARDLIPLDPPRATEPGDILYDIPTTTGDHLRLRLYCDSDSEQVRQLFVSCLVTGAISPLSKGIKDQIHRNLLYNLGFLLVYYIVLPSSLRAQISAFSPRISPIFIWIIISIAYTLRCLSKLRTIIDAHCNRGLQDELKDLGGHYYNPKAKAQGCKMWVIEDVGKNIIAGCIGFDNSIPEPELRRMSIHHRYRRQGLGKLLMRTLLEHVEWYNKTVVDGGVEGGRLVKYIMLGTTTYQPTAIRMYASHGWAMHSKVRFVSWVWGFYMVRMKKTFR